MDQETIRIRLDIMITEKLAATITMKSKKYRPFIAKVRDFIFDEDDAKVIFIRTEKTEFPIDSEEEKPGEYITYIKNVKLVEWIQEEK